MATPNPNLTLHALQSSRSIRISWLLSELRLPYTIHTYPRTYLNKAPPEFPAASGNPLGKSPTLIVSNADEGGNDLVLTESGAITEYLCEKYDLEGRLLPKDAGAKRAKVLMWIHAAEGVFMVHALAITYARWTFPRSLFPQPSLSSSSSSSSSSTSLISPSVNDVLSAMEKGLAVNVRKDLDWLESELERAGTRFLCGDEVTAGDTMMGFSVGFVFRNKLGVDGEGDGKVMGMRGGGGGLGGGWRSVRGARGIGGLLRRVGLFIRWWRGSCED